MPIVEIQGIGRVELGDEFLKLTPEQQDATIQEIAAAQQPQKDRTLVGGVKEVWNNPDGQPSMIGMVRTLYEGARGPGDALAGKFGAQPQTPGVWSEEDEFRAQLGQKQLRQSAEGVAGLAVPGTLRGTAVRTRPPPLNEIAAQKNADYAKFRASGATFEPELTNALADNTSAVLRSQGRFPHLEGQQQVFDTIDLLRNRTTPLPADEFRAVREALNGLKVHPDKSVRSAAGSASEELMKFLERTEPEAAAALRRADKGNTVVAHAQEVNNLGDVADLRTGRAGYGGNAVNNMRQVLSPIVEKAIKGNKQGYNEAEIAAMREIVEGTPATNFARGIGQLSPTKGSIATGLGIASGGLTAVLGAAANKIADVLTRRQFERLNELIRKRSPAYEEAVRRSADKFGTAADQFVIEPTQQNLFKTIAAARALSNGLTRDGISVTSGDLLRSLGSQQKAAADGEEVPPGGQ